MLKSQIFAAEMMECDPAQMTLVAVTLQNEAPKGCHPKIWPTGYFKIDGVNQKGDPTTEYVSCHLFSPGSVNTQTESSTAQAIWKCENQRFNPDYPDVIPPKEECWLVPQAVEKLGISLASPMFTYEIMVGVPGHYNGVDQKAGDRLLTNHLYGEPDHEALIKNCSHIRFR